MDNYTHYFTNDITTSYSNNISNSNNYNSNYLFFNKEFSRLKFSRSKLSKFKFNKLFDKIKNSEKKELGSK